MSLREKTSWGTQPCGELPHTCRVLPDSHSEYPVMFCDLLWQEKILCSNSRKEKKPFSSSFSLNVTCFLCLLLSKPCVPGGAWVHEPEIESHVLYWRSRPDSPKETIFKYAKAWFSAKSACRKNCFFDLRQINALRLNLSLCNRGSRWEFHKLVTYEVIS